ncbi:uncharacterized protein LOC100904717 [Galendromus occidentalis]|uniref:Uncharacterized protein LOC100904717 n=1 Tax=Galendromus occidentalis TaxID=34638 RepID=A0AAJ7L4U1_9ACAR|nr:uncharacterized protein LOC100904717 [Galendromus occidentalis]
MYRGYLLALLVIPTLGSFDPLSIFENAHSPGTVRSLRANETVHAAGSDIVFSWKKCAFCDGYEARLYSKHVSGTRETSYRLRASVTALDVPDFLPRTDYRFVVKQLPSNSPGSEVTGRAFSVETPPPVGNLEVRVLTNSSIRAEWTSEDADGFSVRLLGNGTTVTDISIPYFRNHSIFDVSDLKPETDYLVLVSAFYSSSKGEMMSTVSSASIRTLPTDLPALSLEWEFDTELKISWKNPETVLPFVHSLTCQKDHSETVFYARFAGTTDSVVIPGLGSLRHVACTLITWFSEDDQAQTQSRVEAWKPVPPSRAKSSMDTFRCYYDSYEYGAKTSATHNVERVNGSDILKVAFSEDHERNLHFDELQYKLCEHGESCDRQRWRSLPGSENPKLRLIPGEQVKAWTPYTLQYRSVFICRRSRDESRKYTTTLVLNIPSLIGAVDPVTEMAWRNSCTSPSAQ